MMPPPQGMMPFAAVDSNGNPVLYPSAVPVPTMEPYYGGSLVGSFTPGSQLAGSLVGSNLASSFAPSSYGVFAVGSDGTGSTSGPLRMKEFATGLHRPEADEQRRFLSQQPMMIDPNGIPFSLNGLSYWPAPPAQATYAPYMGPMMNDANAHMANTSSNPNNISNNNNNNNNNNNGGGAAPGTMHYQGNMSNYILNNPMVGMQQMTQSYDSRVHQRMMLAQQPPSAAAQAPPPAPMMMMMMAPASAMSMGRMPPPAAMAFMAAHSPLSSTASFMPMYMPQQQQSPVPPLQAAMPPPVNHSQPPATTRPEMGGNNTPSNQSKTGAAGASDADWDPFFESDD
jgi:hypothetical protein